MECPLQPIERQKRLAVLIDAENAQESIIKNLLDEVAKYGVAAVKRIYGNWTTPQLQGWKDVLLLNSRSSSSPTRPGRMRPTVS